MISLQGVGYTAALVLQVHAGVYLWLWSETFWLNVHKLVPERIRE